MLESAVSEKARMGVLVWMEGKERTGKTREDGQAPEAVVAEKKEMTEDVLVAILSLLRLVSPLTSLSENTE